MSAALGLAGFVLAHSLSIVAALSGDELLAPYAMLVENGERRLQHYEAATQSEAVTRGRIAMAALGPEVERWAFSYEGWAGEGEGRRDAIYVEARARGDDATFRLIQRWRRDERGFALLGPIQIERNGKVRPLRDQEAAAVFSGLVLHREARDAWEEWTRGGQETGETEKRPTP